MENKEKNQKKKTVVMLMALALLGTGSLYMTGNTFSSYMTEQTASGSAQIAKWDVKFTEGSNEITDSYTFDLMDTKTTNSNVDSTTIAPGDSGHIVLNVKGTDTKVAYTYGVALDRTKLNETMGDAQSHIKFYKDDKFTQKWTDTAAIEVALAAANTNHTVDIYWKWIPAADNSATEAAKKAWDVADTTAGKIVNDDDRKVSIDITLTAKQKTN